MGSPSIGPSALGFLSIFLLVLTNAYFVATEFALVAVRRTQLELWSREGRRGASEALAATLELDDAIAATQLGITLASIALGFVGEPTLARLLTGPLAALGFGEVIVHSTAIGIAFTLITFIHVVVGELAPKAIALHHPGRVAIFASRPLRIFARIFRPLLWVMNGAGNGLVSLLGVRPPTRRETAHSAEELSMLVSESRAAGSIRPYPGRILGNVFRLTRTVVQDVMVPRERVFAVERSTPTENLLDLLRETRYTRLPVYDGGLDEMIGILHTKDLLRVNAVDRPQVIEEITRPVSFIRSDLPVVDALREFRRDRCHLAVVRDDDGPVLGVCTLEDVLEEIVGEIEDEHDPPTPAGSD